MMGTVIGMTVTELVPMARDWFTLEEAARELGRSASTLRRQAGAGALKAARSGKKGVWMVHRREIEAYRERTQNPGRRRSSARMIFKGKPWPDKKPDILTDYEWYVLTEHVQNNRTLTDIAKELGNTRQAVGQALQGVIDKYIDDPWD